MPKAEGISGTGLAGVRKLLQKKHREESGKFLVEGRRNVEEALASGWPVETVLCTPEFRSAEDHAALLQRIGKRVVGVRDVSARELQKISDTVHSQGIIAVVRRRRWEKQEPRPQRIVVALDGVSEPGNAGTIIRTCDWFGVERVIAGKNSVEIFSPKVVRSSMGSIFHVPVAEGVHLPAEIRKLKSEGFMVWTTDVAGGSGLDQVQGGQKLAIVLGNETKGVAGEIARLSDLRIRIPRFGKAESLNVAMACGIILGVLRMGRHAGS